MRGERGGRRRRQLAGAGALLMTLAAAGLATGPSAGADSAARSLVGVASASGMRATYTVPDYVVVSEFFDGGGPVAQANVDTTGKATGFGSLPYPGENAVTAPGLLTFASGVPVPGYPLYARADYPVTPSSEVKDPSGTYWLKAAADQGKASGSAAFLFGGADNPVTRASSDATGVLDGGGKLTMTAVGVTEGLSLANGTLKISSVTSKSVTTYEPGSAKPATKTDLVIQGAKVGDQPVTIDRDGVHPGGQTVPVPIGTGSDSLNQALGQAGITVRTVAGNDVEGGGAGDVLEVTWKHTIPVEGNPKGTFVYRLGGASTFILFGAAAPGLPAVGAPADNAPVDGGPAPVGGTPVGPAGGGSAAGSSGSAGDTSASALAGPSGGRAAGPGLAAGGQFGAAAGPAADEAAATGVGTGGGSSTALAAGPAGAGVTQPAILAREVRGTTKFFYAVIGVAGALLLASSALWRLKGVKAAWTS